MSEAVIRLGARDDTGGAFASAKRNILGLKQEAAGLQDSLGAAAARFGTLGAAITAAFAGASLKGAVDLGDQLDDIAEKSGITVEALSALRYAGEVTGAPFEALNNGIRKLSVNMAEAAGGGKEQIAVFRALGVEVKNLDGSLKSSDQVLGEIADRFATFRDGPEKAALAIKIFGKSGAEMIPLLNQGSAGLRELREEGERLGAVIGSDFARQAAAFNDNLRKIELSVEGGKIAIAKELLPTLNELAEAFIATRDGGGAFAEVFGGGLRTAIQASAVVFANVSFVLKGVGREIGAIAAQTVALATLDIKGFKAISDAVKEDARRARAELDAFEQRILQTGRSAAGAGRGASSDPRILGDVGSIAQQAQQFKSRAPVVASAGKAESEDKTYERLNAAVEKRLALALEEQRATQKLSSYRKQELETVDDINRARAEGKITLGQAVELEQKANRAATIAEANAERDRARAIQRAFNVELERTAQAEFAASASALRSLQERIPALRDEIEAEDLAAKANISLAEAVELVAIARLKEKEARLLAQGATTDSVELENLQAELKFHQEILQLMEQKRTSQAGRQAAKDIAEDWNKLAQDIYSGLTDSLFRAFESGKKFFSTLWEGIKNTLKTTVLRVGIQGVMQGVGGALGLSGGGGGGGFNLGSLFGGQGNGLGTIANLFGGGGGGGVINFAGSQIATGAGLGGAVFGTGGGASAFATSAGAFEAGALVEGVGGTAGLAGIGGGAGSMLSVLGPMAAFAAILLLAADMAKGEKRSGGEYGFNFDTKTADFIRGPSGGDPNSDGTKAIISATSLGLADAFKTLGRDVTLEGYRAGWETSEKGRGGVYAGGSLRDKSGNVIRFGEDGSGTNYDPRSMRDSKYEQWNTYDGKTSLNEKGQLQVIDIGNFDSNASPEKFATDVQQSFIAALQASYGLVPKIVEDTVRMPETLANAETGEMNPEWDARRFTRVFDEEMKQRIRELGEMPKRIQELILDVDPEALSAKATADMSAQLTKLFANVNGFRAVVEAMPVEALRSASFDAANSLVELSGGIEKFASNLTTYVENFYTGDEKRAQLAKSLQGQLKGVGLNFTTEEILGGKKENYRQLVEMFEGRTDEQGMKTYAVLLSLSGAFAQLADSADAASTATSKLSEATDAAMQGLRSAIDRSRSQLQAQRDVLQERVTEREDLGALLKDSIVELRGQVPAASAFSAARANSFLDQAVVTAKTQGYLPERESLADAIAAANNGLGATKYANEAEANYQRLVLAGKLAALKDVNDTQLSTDQQLLESTDHQIEQLDDILAAFDAELDAIRGVGGDVGTLVEHMAKVREALTKEKAGAKPATTSSGSGSGPGSAAGGGGGVKPSFGGGGGAAPAVMQPGIVYSPQGFPFDLRSFAQDNLNNPQAIADKAKSLGITQEWFAKDTNQSIEAVRQWFALQGVPAFEVGTPYVERSGLAYIHRAEAIMPARAAQEWRDGYGAGTDVVAQLRQANDWLELLFKSAVQTQVAIQNVSSKTERWTVQGLLTRTATA